MLRKRNLPSSKMTKMGEVESGKGWEQRLDFAERMTLSPKAAHLHMQSASALGVQAPMQPIRAQFSWSHLRVFCHLHSLKTSMLAFQACPILGSMW